MVSDDHPAVGGGDDRATQDAIRETKGERTRRRLLELAVERFGEQGYRATSVSEIARSAGITQAAVYAYYPSKEALFDAAVDSDATSVIDAAWERAQEVPARQLVAMLLVLFISSLEDHPLLARVLAGKEPEALRRLVQLPALDRLTTALAGRIGEAQRTGEVSDLIDPELFAGGAEAIVLSLLMSTSQIGSSTVPRRQLGVLALFDAVLRPTDDHALTPR